MWCKKCVDMKNVDSRDWARYCSKACQAADWPSHKEEHELKPMPEQLYETREWEQRPTEVSNAESTG